MMYAGDETYPDEVTSGPATDEEDDCAHEGTEIEESILGTLYGYCSGCDKPVVMSGPEDEDGIPSWEVAD